MDVKFESAIKERIIIILSFIYGKEKGKINKEHWLIISNKIFAHKHVLRYTYFSGRTKHFAFSMLVIFMVGIDSNLF